MDHQNGGMMNMDPKDQIVQLVQAAYDDGASDIHFVAGKDHCRIKFRHGQTLFDYDVIAIADYLKLLHYIKYRSHLNWNQAKGPQSSAFNLTVYGTPHRIRVSAIYSKYYESLVLRIHDGTLYEQFDNLFHDENQGNEILRSIESWPGLILFTGPTGAGKTTLAYGVLYELKRKGLSIVSIEDPVEHYFDDYVQLEINETAGVEYGGVIKEVLRHDPDVIFIGEIRHPESAKAAIRASLTGHMVISTLHAKNAIQAFYRLQELGISLLELEQVLSLVTNQRLALGEKGKRAILELLNREKIEEALYALKKGEKFVYTTLQELALEQGLTLLKG